MHVILNTCFYLQIKLRIMIILPFFFFLQEISDLKGALSTEVILKHAYFR